MSTPLVPLDLLKKSDKLLFIAHLALGDFTYLQNCFEAFAKAFPHLRIHLWVDERRRTSRASEWEHLKAYSLYDWLAECPYIEKVYNQTYSPDLFKRSIREAQSHAYPIVISLGVLERHKYAILARKISPHGFVVGQKKRVRAYDIPKHLIYRKLDAFIPAYDSNTQTDRHISDIYADWFAKLFGIDIPSTSRFPFVHIPEQWIRQAHEQLAAWGFSAAEDDDHGTRKTVFLNTFSKSIERSWPLERVIDLIGELRKHDAWRTTAFIVNVVPEELDRARKLFKQEALSDVQLFSAEKNFFQLPAILSLCDLIVSVETAVMHLANAVHVPVIALMRQKNPEWAPIDQENSIVITVKKRDDWVDKITVDEVVGMMAKTDFSKTRTAMSADRKGKQTLNSL